MQTVKGLRVPKVTVHDHRFGMIDRVFFYRDRMRLYIKRSATLLIFARGATLSFSKAPGHGVPSNIELDAALSTLIEGYVKITPSSIHER